MDGVLSGNAAALATTETKHGWFVGRFIDTDPYRQTHDVEVKWGRHNKGEKNGFAANKTARTLSVLISGKLRITFHRGEQSEDVLLQNEGDFALWLPCLEHNSVFEADTVVLTIRWPSIADDQIESNSC
jgi:hypothetical protein